MTTARPQQRYDHRLRELVHRTGDLAIASDLGVPPSTARGWLGTAPIVVVSLEVADLTEPELRQEVPHTPTTSRKLAALLQLALVLLRVSGFTLSGERLLGTVWASASTWYRPLLFNFSSYFAEFPHASRYTGVTATRSLGDITPHDP